MKIIHRLVLFLPCYQVGTKILPFKVKGNSRANLPNYTTLQPLNKLRFLIQLTVLILSNKNQRLIYLLKKWLRLLLSNKIIPNSLCGISISSLLREDLVYPHSTAPCLVFVIPCIAHHPPQQGPCLLCSPITSHGAQHTANIFVK